jgi:hypothetical protein
MCGERCSIAVRGYYPERYGRTIPQEQHALNRRWRFLTTALDTSNDAPPSWEAARKRVLAARETP